ncbi:FAD:protein FMN transferase [Marinobacter zhanjiangensis]|uniref:FAD:protein FMN transferase n=1 Tax=Marinobacter zhanjiangensis TaxID=578215 RepID=A0ABQ3B9B6_9GAMM|nr:FAD:protein FMN transferase [Marinobacter zhanjiangensis]GGY85902.1 FAD:protein FMN transferase [Marinobacter zhanjiangensis]
MSIRILAKTLAFVLAGLLVTTPARAEWFRFSDNAMTTLVSLEVWADSRQQAEALWQSVFAEFTQVDQVMSRYRDDSELSRVNREAADHPVPVSRSLFEVLTKAREISEMSDGAFDISFASVGYLYDFRERRQPDDEAVKAGLDRINYRDILLDADDLTVRFRKPGLMLDLGGIAKGYAVDQGIRVLQQAGVGHARLSAGGDMRLLGDRRGRPWVVGVRDPRHRDRQAVVIPVSDTAISTSGDYERFFIDEEGERVHHILSPSTGRPVGEVQSVTIIGDNAMTTDALSTAVFVLGARKGLALIDQLEGIDAVIIDGNRRMHYSQGLMSGE